MSTADFGSLTLVLFVLITLAHILGYISVKLRQPRVLGEIMAGVLLGPSILGHFVPELAANLSNTHISPGNSSEQHAPILGFLYNLGLLLLMFASGAETRGLFHPEDTRQVAWLASVGTGLPFILALVLAPLFPLHLLMGVRIRVRRCCWWLVSPWQLRPSL